MGARGQMPWAPIFCCNWIHNLVLCWIALPGIFIWHQCKQPQYWPYCQ
jgi:hypothetical protein